MLRAETEWCIPCPLPPTTSSIYFRGMESLEVEASLSLILSFEPFQKKRIQMENWNKMLFCCLSTNNMVGAVYDTLGLGKSPRQSKERLLFKTLVSFESDPKWRQSLSHGDKRHKEKECMEKSLEGINMVFWKVLSCELISCPNQKKLKEEKETMTIK